MMASMFESSVAAGVKPTVYIVEDRFSISVDFQEALTAAGFNTMCYRSTAQFWAEFDDRRLGCLLIAARVSGSAGQGLLERLRIARATVPAVFVTPHADIPACVDAMKAGAADVLVMPISRERLLDAIWDAVEEHGRARQERERHEETRKRLERLSGRQRQIMTLVIAGRSSKEIASDLFLSPKTVDNHRTDIMRVMRVDGVVDLVRKVLLAVDPSDLNLPDPEPDGWFRGGRHVSRCGQDRPVTRRTASAARRMFR
jgi:FixJ family two-component response regulator